MPRGVVKQYSLAPETWALEYASGKLKRRVLNGACLAIRLCLSDISLLGWILPMVPFGLADTITSTLDLPTLYQTVRITGREMIGNLLKGKL